MAFESQHLEHPKKLKNELSEDRISSLPDELLINILNFLPTKSAFITTTLSRRWSHLFKQVNTIDFDDPLVFNEPNEFDDSIVEDKSLVVFRAFVRKINCIKLSNLKRFRIISEYCCQCFVRKVESWLSTILSHGIREIDLSFETDIKVPNTIFTCKTLCIFKLSAYAIVNLSETVCLPCLKILHLKKVMVLGLTSVGKFLSGCPLLYDLCLESFSINGTGQLSFSAPSLTRLSLVNSMRFSNYHVWRLVGFVAPLLQYFHYADNLAKSFSIKTSISLIEAYLDIPRFEDFEDASDISHSAYDLIQGVSSVKRLFLSGHCMKALTYVKDELPILSRLTKLELGSSTILHDTLPRLLESAPYLEELIFTKGLFPAKFEEEDVIEQDYWGRHDDVPSCLKTQLKVVEIKYLLGFAEELKMVEYFLCNGSSLERLTIHKLAGVAEPSQVTKQLHKMAKRWNKCVHVCDLLL